MCQVDHFATSATLNGSLKLVIYHRWDFLENEGECVVCDSRHLS